jgi:hypothetical protein
LGYLTSGRPTFPAFIGSGHRYWSGCGRRPARAGGGSGEQRSQQGEAGETDDDENDDPGALFGIPEVEERQEREDENDQCRQSERAFGRRVDDSRHIFKK